MTLWEYAQNEEGGTGEIRSNVSEIPTLGFFHQNLRVILGIRS